MKIENLKISTLLKIVMGSILGFVAILGAVAWIQTDILWKQIKGLYSHPLEVRRAIGELQSDILMMHWGMDELFHQYNTENQEQILPFIRAHEINAKKQFDILFKRYSGPRSDIDVLFQTVNKCQANRQEVIHLLQAGNTEKAWLINIHQQTGPRTSHLQEVMALLQTIDQFSRNTADQYYHNATALNRTLNRQMTFIIAFIILFTAVTSYFLYAWIRNPLKELNWLAEQFREGHFDVRGQRVSSNEFGMLSGAFNQMAEAISNQMELRDMNEAISETLIDCRDLADFRKNILKKLMVITQSQMGAYFLLNQSDNVFEPFTSVGVDHGRLQPFDAAALEGELGNVLTSRKITIVRDIPEDTVFHFKTFTGTILPREMISFPVIIDDVVRGIISLASIKPYSTNAIAIMNQPWATLVNTVFAHLLANDKTRQLSEELQENNQELQIQQEELEAQTEEIKKQSEELQAQNVELRHRQQIVEKANRLKSQFLSNMSHELRTPLNSVMALSRVLMMQAGSKLSNEEINYLEIIERNGKNLLALINDLLDLSKIEAGRMDVHPSPFSIDTTIENIVESIAPLAKEKSIDLKKEVLEGLPFLESDEIRVTQILMNLVANAVKFTDSGGVVIAAKQEEENISIQVTDSGIGISKDDIPYIFDEFHQVDGSSSRKYEGTGLGLAIARKAARMLGGDVAVTSTVARGSVFTLKLPIAWQGPLSTEDDALPVQGHPHLKTALYQYGCHQKDRPEPPGNIDHDNITGQKKILLVEDNEVAIIQIRTVLEKNGYLVDVASGGQKAVDYIARSIPDGIILDLMMPEIDGFDVLERIRSRPDTAKIPVLILTAKDLTPLDFEKLSANNVEQLVQKGDVDQESLLLKIKLMVS